jgi:hypothetical protein
MVRYKRRRRGIVLLIVLSLLALFTVLVVTYLIVAGQYQRTADIFAERALRESLTDTSAKRHLDLALSQVVRDTTERGSAVRFLSLLRDYYGETGFRGTLLGEFPSPPHPAGLTVENWNTSTAFTPSGGQAYTLSSGQFLDLIVDQTNLTTTDGQSFTISNQPGFYDGCVLTITSGPAAGWSSTIVGFLYAGGTPVLRVLNVRYPDITLDWASVTDVSFVVNGRPFSGSGAGFQFVMDSGSGTPVRVAKLNAPVTVNFGSPIQLPSALLPHAIAWDDATNLQIRRGGSNEPYDAPDYQNMFLGLVHPEATNSRDIIPSFHRPALINYWMNAQPALWANDNFKRMVSLRPVEPNFTGSNAAFNYVNGPWDVDNDGDAIPDSIWVDLGMPVQTDPSGRTFKPLFAILCVDLDGRLNVNAHGNPTAYYPNRPANILVAAGNTSNFPKGLGYGPAEISLSSVTNRLDVLMYRRYGSDASPGASGFDLIGRVKFFEEPANYFRDLNTLSYQYTSYSTPADLRGELAFGMDMFGRPMWEQVPATVAESRADSPYEINLVEPTVQDQPFTAADLEAVLRRSDVDGIQLPNRLRELLDLTYPENARLVTTHSFDPPVPGTAVFTDLAEQYHNRGLNNVRSMQELLTVRLLAQPSPPPASAIPNLLKHLMPSELLLGQRLDLNRPLGNARDDTPAGQPGRRVVDEVGEQDNERIWQDVGAIPERPEFQNVPVYHTNGADVNNDGQLTITGSAPNNDHRLARQLLARHIYVLLMALRDENYLLSDSNGNPSEAETARALAQYAVNIVDFRDADSIMTPFEFDIYPFRRLDPADQTTWSVDGNLATDEGAHRGVVWGCERPELLISETLAWHDRRTEDLSTDNGIGTTTTDGTNPDPTYDQRLMPRGAFFVELFNPWTSATDVKTGELYDASVTGVELNKTVTSGGVTSPVWRMMFVKDETTGSPKDPDHFDPAQQPSPDPVTGNDEQRLIYFVDPNVVGATLPPTTGVHGVYSTSLPVAPLGPGQYAVVGSSGIVEGQNYISPVGRLSGITSTEETDTTALQLNNTRRIVLSPMAAGNQVRIHDNGLDPSVDPPVPGMYVNYPNSDASNAPNIAGQPADADILPARAIVINTPRSLSVSEPIDGYDLTNYLDPATSLTVEGYLSSIEDDPLDLNRYGSQLMTDGTHVWGTIHLQRLANPTEPFHAILNPYRTIDSLRVDLTSFNGVTAISDASSTSNVRLHAVQRGDRQGGTRRFWPQEPFTGPTQSGNWHADPNATHYFNFQMRASLGCLNHGFWTYNPAAAGVYRGSPSVNVFDGDTRNDQAFSSLAWNNRPFVSQYELMQVPMVRSSELLREYTLASAMGPSETPYDTDNPTPQYRHLVNFFHSSPFNRRNASVHAYRLLEYVQVPSRFVGTELLLNPSHFKNHLLPSPPNTPNQIANPISLNPSFLTPFNRVSAYRDPGRVNINTIFHSRVWNALFDGYSGPSYDAVVASRRGFAADINTLLPTPDPNFPTYFANPFRPPGHGGLAPLAHLERHDIETTLLRSNAIPPDYADPPDAPPPARDPLFQGGHVGTNAASLASTHHRNSHFRYNALRRLGNMVTTRSNVYAIWITVGYFEVESNPGGVDTFHPDGYRVAQELGSTDGQRRRHRAFYIVDRTIPVAFEPGQDHNIERCILLRRFIE